jgi:hypothetical protein
VAVVTVASDTFLRIERQNMAMLQLNPQRDSPRGGVRHVRCRGLHIIAV